MVYFHELGWLHISERFIVELAVPKLRTRVSAFPQYYSGPFLHMSVLFVLYDPSVPTYLPVMPIVTINSKSKVFLKNV